MEKKTIKIIYFQQILFELCSFKVKMKKETLETIENCNFLDRPLKKPFSRRQKFK